ncbi:hypothetical protein KA005_44755 [bacterium]|nr:hypothetical protein [bacterium]
MTELFNNREIAIALWTTVFFGWAFSRKEVRRSIFQLVKSFFSPKIIIPFTLLFTYSFLVVLLFREIHIWSLSNLKETIYWFIFSGIIITFRSVVNETTEKPIRKIVKELVAFTIILEFIVNTYMFKLLVELFFVPTIAILTAVYTYATIKTEYKIVEKILGTLLAIIGIAMFTQALIQIYYAFDKFARLDTVTDFILPPILSISILPAIYLLLLYASYELLFIRVDLILNSKEMQRYAKKLLILHCGFKVGKVKYMLKFRVNQLYNTASKEEIRTILFQDEKSPVN